MEPDADHLPMEVAYVLFLDMVGSSRLSLDEQARAAHALRDLVRGTPEFLRCEADDDLLRSDTGDGVALAFFRDPQSPIRCACEIAAALGTPPRLLIRIGLHSGSVFRTDDINDRKNVTGPGIIVAQRVMDCGDAGHILLSRTYADLLRPLEHWAPNLHDLGEVTVKHGLPLFLVSYHAGDCGNPVLPKRSPPPPVLEAVAPTNLPFWRTDQFVGRAPTLALVHDLLQTAAPVALVGLPGLGKTQLALHYAHLHPQDYPGGVFWINAADSSRLKEGYATVGRSFFEIPEDLSMEVCVTRLRDRLHHLTQPALFVFDNVTEETDLSLLPASPLCRLLLTAQQRHLFPPTFERVALPKLDPDAALTLLGASAASLGGDELAARQIADAVGRLPIALALLAQHRARLRLGFVDYRRHILATAPAAPPSEQNLLHALERARGKFVAATGHKGRLYETIERSYLSLSPTARTVLAAAACFAPASLGRSLLWDFLGPGAGDESWAEGLADLTDASLISEEEPPELGASESQSFVPRLHLHELVRLFARMQFSQEQHHAHIARLSDVLTDRLQSANDNMDWRGIRPETAHFSLAVGECRRDGLPDNLCRLLIALGRYLTSNRDFSGAETHLREALALAQSLHGPISGSRAQILRLLSEAEHIEGNGAQALRDARASLRIAKRVYAPDAIELWEYYAIVGYMLKDRGRFRRARLFYERMRLLHMDIHGGRHPKVAQCLNNLGMWCLEQGEIEEAERHLREALALESVRTTQDGPPASITYYWNNLGIILGKQQRWAEALEAHGTALATDEHIHGRTHARVASGLFYSAVALHALRRWDEARAHYDEALILYRRLFGEDNFRCVTVREKLSALAAEE